MAMATAEAKAKLLEEKWKARQKEFAKARPSRQLEMALQDFEAVRFDSRYKIDLNEAHAFDGEACHVCLGGAVMANTLRFDPRRSAFFTEVEGDLVYVLDMLDAFRLGNVDHGLRLCGAVCYREKHGCDDFDVPDYAADPNGFIECMYEIVDDLRSNGF
jgi:hypothetical protein